MSDLNARTTLSFSSAGHLFTHLFMLLFPTVVLALEDVFDTPYHQLIGLMFLGNVLFGVLAVPAGFLGDRWSPAWLMVVFFLGIGAAAVATGFASSPWQVGAGLTAIGMFAAIYHPVGIAWVVRGVANRGKALGINGVFGSFGVGLAPIVAGLLTDYGSWRLAFIVPGVAALLAGLGLAWCVRAGIIHDDKTDVAAQPAEASRGDMRRGALVLLTTVAVSGLIYQATAFALPKLFASRLGDVLGDGLIGVSLAVSAIYFCSGGAQILGGWIADRFNLKRVYLVCWSLQVPLLILAANIDSLLLIPVVIAMVLSNTTAVPTENSLFARYTPPRWRGTAFGVKFLVTLGIASASIPLIAWIHATTGGFFWLLILLAGLATIGGLAATRLPDTAKPRKPAYNTKPEPAA